MEKHFWNDGHFHKFLVETKLMQFKSSKNPQPKKLKTFWLKQKKMICDFGFQDFPCSEIFRNIRQNL